MNESVSSFTSVISKSELSLSPLATTKMAELFESADDDLEAIRVFVSGGGCNGMGYGMTFTDTLSEQDRVLETDGFKIYVDVVAMGFLQGVEIDYVDRPTGATFVFNNAFAVTGGSGTCGGCGSSGGGGGGCG